MTFADIAWNDVRVVGYEKETALQEAQRVTSSDRPDFYGPPYEDFTCSGRIQSALLERWLRQQPGFEHIPRVPDLPPHLAALLQIPVKLSREFHRHKQDNLVDTIGYTNCADMCKREEEKRG